MTRKKETEKQMNELEREYRETRDEKIIDELYELVRELEKMEKKVRQQ
jgi:uncharacterized protein YcbK (DUF882 family)